MKAKQLAELLMKEPDADVKFSVWTYTQRWAVVNEAEFKPPFGELIHLDSNTVVLPIHLPEGVTVSRRKKGG